MDATRKPVPIKRGEVMITDTSQSTQKAKRHLIPDEIRNRPQWVPWRYGKFRRDGSREKQPINPSTGKQGDWRDPGMWCSFPDAVAYAQEHHADGVGFVFSEDDPYCGVDLDNCLDPVSGGLRPGVAAILDQLDAYAEGSPSGAGIKCIVRATKPGGRCKTEDTPWGGKFEMYDRNQFFTITGDVIRDAPVRDAQVAVNALYGRFFPSVVSRVGTEPATASAGFPGDDGDLLEKARNHPKTGGMVRKLHDHDGASGYPSRSEADMAYCGMLAYWTGCDAERIKRLFRASPRSRGKYAEKGRHAEGYLDGTVNRAISECRSTYDPSYGEGKKARVRKTVSYHRDALAKSDLRGGKRAVMDYLLGVAPRCGMDRGGKVEFNANQQEIADAVGVGQRQVSNIIKDLLRTTPLTRKSKGKKGENSVYLLPAVADTSTTYVHRGPDISPPVSIRSRSEDQFEPVEPPGEPRIPKANPVRTGPEIVAEFREADGHSLGCGCDLCLAQAPSYVTYAPDKG